MDTHRGSAAKVVRRTGSRTWTSAATSSLKRVQLPGVANAVIEPRKLRDYILSSSHPVGRTKAEFFVGLGYARESWHVLAADLREMAERVEASEVETNRFGTKYEVRGNLTGPAGRQTGIVSAWIILAGEDFPRFVTAYPEST